MRQECHCEVKKKKKSPDIDICTSFYFLSTGNSSNKAYQLLHTIYHNLCVRPSC